ncbi:MAG: hemerythrin domain-containing protein [Dehalococcoidia bacterium]|nr:hemerythrin domain-containing protein [Dehalococcoidia bacterium]
MPDPVKMLKDDHNKVKGLFSEFESADGRSKMRIAKEAMTELEIHTKLEEEIFYPAMQRALKEEELMAEAEEEHHVAKVLIKELEAMERADVHFDAKFTVLAENVKHHIKEEESEMLPKASKIDRTELDRLGEEMQARREQLMTENKESARTAR